MATQYALAFPDRVDRLALIAPAGLVSGLRLRFLLRVYRLAFRPSESHLESFFDTVVTPAGRGRLRQDPWRLIMQQCAVGMMGFKFAFIRAVRPTRSDLRRLSSARIPVLVIIGRDESVHDGPKMAARFRQRLPEARIEIVEDANHIIPVDQPRSWKSCSPNPRASQFFGLTPTTIQPVRSRGGRRDSWDAEDAFGRAQRPALSAAMARPAHARSETVCRSPVGGRQGRDSESDHHSGHHNNHDRDDPGGRRPHPRRLRQHQPSVTPGRLVGLGDQTLANTCSSCTSTTGLEPRPTDYELA